MDLEVGRGFPALLAAGERDREKRKVSLRELLMLDLSVNDYLSLEPLSYFIYKNLIIYKMRIQCSIHRILLLGGFTAYKELGTVTAMITLSME